MNIQAKDGYQSYFITAGDPANPAVILLHGIGADHKMWQPQLEPFAAAGFFVIAPDLYGHGQSSRLTELDLEDWNNQILALLKHINKNDCILIGVSMGGVIAQHFAIQYPGKVNKLVLSDTFGELKTLTEKVLGFSQVVGFRIYKLLGSKLLARGMASAYNAPFAAQAQEYFRRVSLNADFDQLILARKAINTIDAIGKIDGRQISTLVMVGKEFGNSFVEINRKIHDGIEGSRFIILDQSMDPSSLVNPEAFNQVVLAFLSN